ncbi:MAG: metal-dependent hydrolase [Gammaproteobacteria bacterium]|nr:MAG: metal-dependent hydrolase [Gammaproteobacteria bacterium]
MLVASRWSPAMSTARPHFAPEAALSPRRIEVSLNRASVHWVGGDPVTSHFFNALSALIPPVERIVIRILRDMDRATLPDPLARDIRGLIQQEAWHSRIHRQCNQALALCGYSAIPGLDGWLERALRLVVRCLPRKLKLALPYAFELYTASLSLAVLERGNDWGLEDADTPEGPHKVLIWHALEELEHQDVCGDLLEALDIRRRWGSFAALAIMPVLLTVVALTHLYFMHTDRSLYRPRHVRCYLGMLIRQRGPYGTLVGGVLRRLWRGEADYGNTGRAGVLRALTQFTG